MRRPNWHLVELPMGNTTVAEELQRSLDRVYRQDGGAADVFLTRGMIDHKSVGPDLHFRVQWLGCPEEKNTWEPARWLYAAKNVHLFAYLKLNGFEKKISAHFK